MKRIDSSYKLIEFLSGRRSSADAVVNVATVEFRFGAVVLIEILVFNVAYENLLSPAKKPNKSLITLISRAKFKKEKHITPLTAWAKIFKVILSFKISRLF